MAERGCPERCIELCYDYDRLFSEKILQVYGLLVPERIRYPASSASGTRMPGGVGGVEPRGSPLSRSRRYCTMLARIPEEKPCLT
jgi:hypothetical protein